LGLRTRSPGVPEQNRTKQTKTKTTTDDITATAVLDVDSEENEEIDPPTATDDITATIVVDVDSAVQTITNNIAATVVVDLDDDDDDASDCISLSSSDASILYQRQLTYPSSPDYDCTTVGNKLASPEKENNSNSNSSIAESKPKATATKAKKKDSPTIASGGISTPTGPDLSGPPNPGSNHRRAPLSTRPVTRGMSTPTGKALNTDYRTSITIGRTHNTRKEQELKRKWALSKTGMHIKIGRQK
jgi:hypothetical protein